MMILEDARSVKAALATMNPVARNATQLLAMHIIQDTRLMNDDEELKKTALECCAIAFLDNGNSLDTEQGREKFSGFLEDHGANVLDIAISIIICVAKSHKRRQRWGVLGKAAAAAGLVAVGAFFG